MPPKMNLLGQKFTRLTVISESPIRSKAGNVRWVCRCDCGTETMVETASLRRGTTKSCGCLRKEIFINNATKHGYSKKTEHIAWEGMKRRCSNKNDRAYKHYGDRGITVCARWLNSFEAFLRDVGNRPSSKHSIDRIDNNGNYEPGNVKWSTQKEQNNNTRRNHILIFDGQRHTIPEWSEITGIKSATIHSRIIQRWSIEKTLTTPI